MNSCVHAILFFPSQEYLFKVGLVLGIILLWTSLTTSAGTRIKIRKLIWSSFSGVPTVLIESGTYFINFISELITSTDHKNLDAQLPVGLNKLFIGAVGAFFTGLDIGNTFGWCIADCYILLWSMEFRQIFRQLSHNPNMSDISLKV